MNGNPAGHEPADPGSPTDPRGARVRALALFNQTAKAACDIGEWKLQREAEDAAGRAESYVRQLDEIEAGAARERLSSGQGVHGQDSPQAEVDAAQG